MKPEGVANKGMGYRIAPGSISRYTDTIVERKQAVYVNSLRQVGCDSPAMVEIP